MNNETSTCIEIGSIAENTDVVDNPMACATGVISEENSKCAFVEQYDYGTSSATSIL